MPRSRDQKPAKDARRGKGGHTRRAVPANRVRQAPKPRAAQPRRQKKRSAAAGRDSVTGQFKKGFSGNPKGINIIVPEEVRELARTLSAEAIHRLAYWMRSSNAQASIVAAKIILDRGLGKAVQPLIGGNGQGLVNITIGNGGRPINDPVEAGRVYAEIIGNPSVNIDSLRFAVPGPPQAGLELCGPQRQAALKSAAGDDPEADDGLEEKL